MKIYGLINENGEEVLRGTAQEIGEKVSITDSSIYQCERKNKKLFGKYSVILIEEVFKSDKRTKKPRKTKHEIELEYLLKHLKTYGNVYSKNIPSATMMNELKTHGFDIKIETYQDRGNIDYILIAR